MMLMMMTTTTTTMMMMMQSKIGLFEREKRELIDYSRYPSTIYIPTYLPTYSNDDSVVITTKSSERGLLRWSKAGQEVGRVSGINPGPNLFGLSERTLMKDVNEFLIMQTLQVTFWTVYIGSVFDRH